MRIVSKFNFAIGILGALTMSAFADSFVNGGFEDGTFNGWTKGGGTWAQTPHQAGGAISYDYSGDPGKSDIITNPNATDPNTLGNLYEVLQGGDSARVNNEDNGYHFSTLTQTVSNYTDPNMYLGFAAVLQEPSNAHPPEAAPHFSYSIYDNTDQQMVYSTAFNVYNAASTGITWNNGLTDGAGTWKYSDWNVVHVDTSLIEGHSFTVSVSAYDCGWGGHGGYAYVDDFQPDLPVANHGSFTLIEAADLPQNTAAVPEPTSVGLWLLGGVALFGIGKRRLTKLTA